MDGWTASLQQSLWPSLPEKKKWSGCVRYNMRSFFPNSLPTGNVRKAVGAFSNELDGKKFGSDVYT